MDFDKPKVYGDTSITDGLVLNLTGTPKFSVFKINFYYLYFNPVILNLPGTPHWPTITAMLEKEKKLIVKSHSKISRFQD